MESLEEKYEIFKGRVIGLELALWDYFCRKPQGRFVHSSLGHEAAAFFVTSILPSDQALWALYYRCHAWLLALGVPISDIIEEILGKQQGKLGGRAGSMHLLLHPNIIDCNSIVGAQVPIAVGASIANRGTGLCTVCVLGDGATNTGVFYEALNIAALYQAPILFVVEDNKVAMDIHYEQTSLATIQSKFHLFSIPFLSTSSEEINSVYENAKEAIISAQNGPTAFCVRNKRIGQHVVFAQDPPFDSIFSIASSDKLRITICKTYYESMKLLGVESSENLLERIK